MLGNQLYIVAALSLQQRRKRVRPGRGIARTSKGFTLACVINCIALTYDTLQKKKLQEENEYKQKYEEEQCEEYNRRHTNYNNNSLLCNLHNCISIIGIYITLLITIVIHILVYGSFICLLVYLGLFMDKNIKFLTPPKKR